MGDVGVVLVLVDDWEECIHLSTSTVIGDQGLRYLKVADGQPPYHVEQARTVDGPGCEYGNRSYGLMGVRYRVDHALGRMRSFGRK